MAFLPTLTTTVVPTGISKPTPEASVIVIVPAMPETTDTPSSTAVEAAASERSVKGAGKIAVATSTSVKSSAAGIVKGNPAASCGVMIIFPPGGMVFVTLN